MTNEVFVEFHSFPSYSEDLEGYVYEKVSLTHADRTDYSYMSKEAPCDNCPIRSTCAGECNVFKDYLKTGSWEVSKRPRKW